MSILVNELRLSLIWKKSFPGETYLPYLSDPDRYRSEFELARQGRGKWLLPWHADKPQRFWGYYLLRKAPDDFHSVTPQAAREYLVPLRAPTWARAKARSGVTATLEGFCFPHSIGVVITLYLRPESPLSMDQMVDATVAARFADFNLSWEDGETATHGALVSLADKIIDRLHREALHGQTPIGKPLRNPITVATIIDASGAWKNADGSVGLGRALNALCLLELGWRDLPYETGRLPDDVMPKKEQTHQIAGGRVNWIPKHFSEVEQKGRRTSLGCYHRNVTLASLQTLSLTALIGRADEVLSDAHQGRLVNIHKDVVQAISLVNDFDFGNNQTYKSWHLKYQISFNRARIDRVSKALGV